MVLVHLVGVRIPEGQLNKKKYMNYLMGYYVLCVVYCFFQLSSSYRKRMMPGGLGISPGLDAMMVLLVGWALAPIDIVLTWVRLYKEACAKRKETINIDTKCIEKEIL
jgi:hypothetical protein